MLDSEKTALAEKLLQKSVELRNLKAAGGISAEASDASEQVLSLLLTHVINTAGAAVDAYSSPRLHATSWVMLYLLKTLCI